MGERLIRGEQLVSSSVVLLIAAAQILLSQVAMGATAVVGHRGGDSAVSPENTIVAIENSFSKGIWGHEIDVRTTLDGDLVLMHDGTIDRTTNGTGSTNQISTEALQNLDAGSWKGAAFAGERVPLLSEALSSIGANGTRAYLDIKAGSATGVQDAVTVSGFDPGQLTFLTFYDFQSTSFINQFASAEVFRSLHGTAYDPSTVDASLASFASIGVAGVTIRMDHFSPEYVEAVHQAGLKIAVVGGAVQSKQLAEAYITAGVDELWLDDIDTNLQDYKDGEGGLMMPSPPPFRITTVLVDTDTGNVTLTWGSVRSGTYRIESSSNLKDWDTIMTDIEGSSGETTSHTLTVVLSGEGNTFYRVAVVN